jgi:phosphatidylserine/phosphatidylglycerophosphate/cardiolipin synthase-like enzyme
MSLLLEAFPQGRPFPRALSGPVNLVVMVAALAMVAVLVPFAGTAEARRTPKHVQAHGHKHARGKTAPPVVGQPPRNYVMPATSFFSFPNRTRTERKAIRDRVLYTIQSVWGGSRNSLGTPLPANGTIRIATWSFDDWGVARALVAARNRGVSVQVVAAKAANTDHQSWEWLRKRLRSRLFRPGHPVTGPMYSFARECRGACRGPGGTPHSKYFLFDNVGAGHLRHVTVQTSMNLTRMAYRGQWNQAQVMHSARVYNDFAAIFRQSRLARPLPQPYHVASLGPVVNYFFPRPQAKAAQDPVMQTLRAVSCRGATAGSGSGRSSIRIIQYAIYGDRGVWIAKKLRQLWNSGCDVAIIYAVSSRPVLGILRNRSGRGAVPMRQSVVTDPWGNIVKYNHSKWMTITGHWGSNTAAYVTFSGSANWANLAFGDDEQMQRIQSRPEVLRHLATFAKTWRQTTSNAPAAARVTTFARTIGAVTQESPDGVPEGIPEEPTFGQGIYRYLPPD